MNEKTYFTKQPLFTAAVVFIILIVAGVAAIQSFLANERNRSISNWKITLGVLAENKTDSVEQWVAGQTRILQNLATNGSLQLYTQQLQKKNATQETGTDEAIEQSYLRNFIHDYGQKYGFYEDASEHSPIRANIVYYADNGLVLLDRQLNLITATPGASQLDENLRGKLKTAHLNGHILLDDLLATPNDQQTVGLLVPVHALQTGGKPELVGFVYGFKNAASTLFPLFQPKAQTLKTSESYLVKKSVNQVVNLTPLADGSQPLRKLFSLGDADIAAVRAVLHPGEFGQLRDYSGDNVLCTSRQVSGTEWVVVQKISLSEALRETAAHQRFIATVFGLTLLVILAMLTAAWWYGDSMRQQKDAAELRHKKEQLMMKSNILDAINQSSSDFTLLIDDSDHILFCNEALGKQLGLTAEALKGKTIRNTFGPETAARLTEFLQATRRTSQAVVAQFETYIQTKKLVLHGIFTPVSYGGKGKKTILATLHDVSELQASQQKQAKLQQQLIAALMRAIDIHDPYSVNHSEKTARIANLIAKSLNLPSEVQSVVDRAANLCNIGKLFIPKDILTKTDELSEAELELLRKETRFAAEILTDIEFDGPVLETIMQKHEYLDGTGHPKGLHHDAILMPARILAVANAFVAMVSPRAYRQKFERQKALDVLLKDADSKYDRKVVAALFHVAENELTEDDSK